MNRRWMARAVAAVVVRPTLWPAAVRQTARLARPGWWRRWPPLPRPAEPYLRFRFRTAFGRPDASPEPVDVVEYLQWCRTMRDLSR